MRTLYDIGIITLGVGIGIIILGLISINKRFKAEYLEGRRDGLREGYRRGKTLMTSSAAHISMESGIKIIEEAIRDGKKFPISVPFKRLIDMSEQTVREIECGMKLRGYDCTFEMAGSLALWFTVTRIREETDK